MTQPTLESRLRLRLEDTRAMVAALSINADRIFLTFGAVGDNERITLRIVGDEIGSPDAFEAPVVDETIIDPDKFGKPDLIAIAEREGVDFKAGDTKAEIAAAINAARSAAKE